VSNYRPTRAAATVTEVAAMCQLSRSRFYEWFGPVCSPNQSRMGLAAPFSSAKMEKCLEIRETGVGLNNTIIVFNRRRPAARHQGGHNAHP